MAFVDRFGRKEKCRHFVSVGRDGRTQAIAKTKANKPEEDLYSHAMATRSTELERMRRERSTAAANSAHKQTRRERDN
jgi:hypothetical protein